MAVVTLGIPVLVFADSCSGTSCTLQNPLKVTSICGLLQTLLAALLAIGTPVAILFFIYAGFRFVTARGNAEQLGAAKTNLRHVVIGIALFIGAWVLGQIIANTLNQLGVPLVGNCQ